MSDIIEMMPEGEYTSACRVCEQDGTFELNKNKFIVNDTDILLITAFNSFSSLDSTDGEIYLCTACTESLILSYTFWDQVRQSDEKWQTINSGSDRGEKSFETLLVEAHKSDEASEYTLMNVIDSAASDNDDKPHVDNDASIQCRSETLKRKRPRTSTKTSPKDKPVAKMANLQNMALPHITISNNSNSENEDDDAILTLDQLIEQLSPRQKFKTVNLRPMKLDANDVENSAAEFRNITKMCNTSADDGKSIFKCQHCPKAFATVYYLMLHTRKSHVCQHCLEAFEKPTDLYAHIKEKHDKFECLLCGRVFRSNSNLRQHMRKMHSVFLPAHVSLLNLEKK